jgi:lipopolysaccharide heptosyltransferase II
VSATPERIGIIRFSSLGDIVCTSPVIRALDTRFPEASISYITTSPYQDLVSAIPGVDEVFGIRRRGEGFQQDVQQLVKQGTWDRIADLQGSPRSKRLVQALQPKEVLTDKPPRLRRSVLLATRLRLGQFLAVPDRMLSTLAPWGVEGDGGSLELKLTDERIASVIEKHGDQLARAIVLVPGAKHATKRWPDEYWRSLVDELPDDRLLIVLGGAGEFPDSLNSVGADRFLDLTGKTDILEAAAVLKLASLVISGDTGPMHLAVAVGAPVVAMFGPTVREFGFYPYRHKQSVILEQSLWCRPCSAHGSSKCPLGHHRCLREITPDRVSAAARSLLH